MFKRLLVYHHLGLGDHFICNALVHHFAENFAEEIWLPVKEANLPTVKHLYEDHENIKIISTSENEYHKEILGINNLSTQYNVPLLKIGFNGDNSKEFDRSFYDQVGLDFDLRWAGFKAPYNDQSAMDFYNEIIGNGEPYALVHDTGSIGSFNLNLDTTLRIIKIQAGLTDSLLNWKSIIENAEEIHCIDSSVIHLVDSLRVGASRLVFHDVGRPSKFNLFYEWERKTYK